jgi:hypothetical protein
LAPAIKLASERRGYLIPGTDISGSIQKRFHVYRVDVLGKKVTLAGELIAATRQAEQTYISPAPDTVFK